MELVDLATGNASVHKQQTSGPGLLGFFFTEAPGADVVLVGSHGLELCEYAAKRRGLRCGSSGLYVDREWILGGLMWRTNIGWS